MKQDSARIILRRGGTIIDPDARVEWYSGREHYDRPKHVRINDVWEDIFSYEKSIREDKYGGAREIVFRCHIGDNRIVDIAVRIDQCDAG